MPDVQELLKPPVPFSGVSPQPKRPLSADNVVPLFQALIERGMDKLSAAQYLDQNFELVQPSEQPGMLSRAGSFIGEQAQRFAAPFTEGGPIGAARGDPAFQQMFPPVHTLGDVMQHPLSAPAGGAVVAGDLIGRTFQGLNELTHGGVEAVGAVAPALPEGVAIPSVRSQVRGSTQAARAEPPALPPGVRTPALYTIGAGKSMQQWPVQFDNLIDAAAYATKTARDRTYRDYLVRLGLDNKAIDALQQEVVASVQASAQQQPAGSAVRVQRTQTSNAIMQKLAQPGGGAASGQPPFQPAQQLPLPGVGPTQLDLEALRRSLSEMAKQRRPKA